MFKKNHSLAISFQVPFLSAKEFIMHEGVKF